MEGATGETRERITAALTHLEESGDVALKRGGVRQGYRLLREDVKPRDLALRLEERFKKREEADLRRLRGVVELAETGECLTRFVTRHFGEEIAECGHCDRCRGVAARELPRSLVPEVTQEQMEAIRAVKDERHAALRSPRQLARFLCGIGSPAAQRAKLSRHECFGLLGQVPFAEVLVIAEQSL